MAQDFAVAFYTGSRWRKCRAAYIAKRIMIDGGLCERCHEKQGSMVHHRIRLTADNIGDDTISLNHANLMYECKDCHDLEEGHGVNPKITPRVVFDDNGDAVGAI